MNIAENTTKNTHNVVAALLPSDPQLKVLDIPSGAGAFTQRLMNRNIEVHPSDIENLMEVKNQNFRSADMNEKLPYPDNFFDAVVCIDGIEHLENPFSFIRESFRILRPGGSIILSTPNVNSMRSRWRWFWTSHHNKDKVPLNEMQPSYLHHINMMPYQRLRYILHRNGFRIDIVTTNRVKLIAWVYGIFVPFAFLVTKLVFNKEEKDPGQRERNKEIVRHLFGKSLLFGETMILRAVKQ